MSIVSTRIARGTLAPGRRPILLAAAGGLLAGLVAFAGSQAIQALPDGEAASLAHPARYQTVPPHGCLHQSGAAVCLAAWTAGERSTDGTTGPSRIGDGLAENSWDFSAADGVPGFGPLDPGAAGR
jgi:hypothetical protein